MLARIAAITFIFLVASAAWVVLGGTVWSRTTSFDARLKQKVAGLWGEPHEQQAPWACAGSRRIGPSSSRVRAGIDLEYRRKGLLWYSTYRVAFSGEYAFRNQQAEPLEATLYLPLPAAKAVYDDLAVTVNGEPAAYENSGGSVTLKRTLAPGETLRVRFAYRSRGLDRWRYRFGKTVSRVEDFALIAAVNFRDFDFENDSLSPSSRRDMAGGAELTWRYGNLLAGSDIAISMPERLQPGPLAGEISFFAPVSLAFFFFVIFLISTLRGIDLHPMNYAFLAAAFFSFHLLLAYLADHIDIHAAFLICSLVSMGLAISYLRLAVGIRFAAVEAGIAQFVYLVMFSYAFFFRGYTGLAVTIGAIVTLFVAMQVTGRIRWSERFRTRPPAAVS